MDEQAILERVRGHARRLAEGRAVALYAIGSLGHGGFSRLASDIDLALVLAGPDASVAAELADALRDLAMPVSVFWESLDALRREHYLGRFPACDRWDLREHGKLIVGSDCRREVPRPPLRDLVRCAVDLSLKMLSRPAAVPGGGTIDATPLIRDPARLVGRGPRDASKIVLLPIRFLYTLRTTEVGRLDQAVELFLRDPSDDPRRRLVEAALSWRANGIAAPAHAAALCREALLPIYLELVDEHLAWLARDDDDDDRERIAELVRWRARLIA